MRRGKEIAQCAHASIAFLSHYVRKGNNHNVPLSEAEQLWLDGIFTKVCLQVNSEEELLRVYEEALRANLTVHLIEDRGLTEFHGKPTKTCLAIGPDYNERIDAVTGGLQLYQCDPLVEKKL